MEELETSKPTHLDSADYWHYDSDGKMICNRDGGEVWFLGDGYICTHKTCSFNEDKEAFGE